MQHPFSCLPSTYEQIEATLAPARLARYLTAAEGDKHLALRLYVWNSRLCESVYLPLQFAEVSSRNAISKPVQRRFGANWYSDNRFRNLLPARQKDTLSATIRKQAARRRGNLNQDHIVAGLPFGFWTSLMTSSYENHLWANGIRHSFPNSGVQDTRQTIYNRLDKIRNFRNLIAHHFAVFDKGIQAELQNAVHVTNMICTETSWLSNMTSNLSRTINQRPRR